MSDAEGNGCTTLRPAARLGAHPVHQQALKKDQMRHHRWQLGTHTTCSSLTEGRPIQQHNTVHGIVFVTYEAAKQDCCRHIDHSNQ